MSSKADCAKGSASGALLLVLALVTVVGCASNGGTREGSVAPAVSGKVEEIAAVAGEAPRMVEGEVAPGSDEGIVASDDTFGEDPFAEDDQGELAPDPLEPFNRGVFWFNDKLYFYVMKPTVKAYRFLVHEKIRQGVSNFFSNLASPVYIVNDVLQARGMDAGREGFRFLVNSTLGVFGFFDIAKDYGGLSRNAEDMGQTLGSYGVDHGFYLVLPVLGPSSLRDGVGTLTDFSFHPVTYAGYDLVERGEIKAAELTTDLSLDKDTYETVVRQSIDPYLTIRNGYLQYRRAQVQK